MSTLAPTPTSPSSPPTAARRRSVPALVVQTMRPRQWIKNTFVLAGVVFSGQLTHAKPLAQTLAVAIAFCLVSGATYLLNDALDAEADRLNPRTAGRPIARGDLSVRSALLASALVALVGVGGALAVGWQPAVVLVGYLVMQLAYSNGLKHVLFLDVMVIATGFSLRTYAGIVAIDVVASPWIVLCTFLLALFLGLAKRRGEAIALGGGTNPQRPVLDYYSVELLDQLIGIVTPCVVVAYALYTVEGAKTNTMLLTVPFVVYGIFRVLFLMHAGQGTTEEPDGLVFRDRPLLLCVVLWIVAAGIVTVAS